MLDSVRKNGGKLKPTRLMYKANLSHDSLSRYLSELEAKGMIAPITEGGQKYYTVTENGANFLSEFKKMQQFQETFGL